MRSIAKEKGVKRLRSRLGRLRARFNSYIHVITSNIYNRSGLITYPYAAHFIPTWRCNLKCKMCNVWKMPEGSELTTEEMLKVLRQLKSLDIIKITGGEPFLRKDLDILVNEIRKEINPFILHIITNGVATDRILEFARSVGYEAIQFRVSIDGIGKTHDTMRGADGAFDRAYSTLDGLVRLRESKGFGVGVNYNVTDETLQDMDEMFKLCNDLKVDFVPGIPVTPFLEDVNPGRVVHRIIGIADRERFREKYKEKVARREKGLNLLEGSFLKKIDNDIFDKLISDNIHRKFRCRELRNLIYIHPDGKIVTCGLNHKRVGNLFEENLKDLWFSKGIRTFRQKVDECTGCLQSAVEILSRLYYWI